MAEKIYWLAKFKCLNFWNTGKCVTVNKFDNVYYLYTKKGYSLEQAQVVGIVGIVGMVGMVGIVGINK